MKGSTSYKFIAIVVATLLICYSQASHAQNENDVASQDSVIVIDEIIEDEALLLGTYETPAEFPGGMKALIQFIKDNQHYPDECLQLGIEGRSIIRFIITEEGDVDRIELIRSSGNTLLDEEALRIVRIMPRWTPMMICYPTEHAVRSWWTLPIKFELPQEIKNKNIEK